MCSPLDSALLAIDAAGNDLDEAKQLVRAKVRALAVGYDSRWQTAGYEAIAVEQVYQADLWNPETNKRSRTFRVAGKIDVVASLYGRTWIIDHKTTSHDIADPDAPFWRQLAIEGQVNHYMLLQWLHGVKPDGALWDVIRKPTISPKKLTKAERASAVAERRYCGRQLSMDTLAALQTDERENAEMYEARLVNDCMLERPEWYFARRPVPRLDHEILDYASDLWEIGQEILESRKRARLPKSSGSCIQYNAPCRFLGICSGHDTPDSDRWRSKRAKHGELDGTELTGDVLTNSRIRNFQSCKVRHYYDYELGIERQDEEEKEALYFGSLMHVALEAWWKGFLVEVNDGKCNNGSPATAAGTPSAAETQLAG